MSIVTDNETHFLCGKRGQTVWTLRHKDGKWKKVRGSSTVFTFWSSAAEITEEEANKLMEKFR